MTDPPVGLNIYRDVKINLCRQLVTSYSTSCNMNRAFDTKGFQSLDTIDLTV